MNDKTEGTLVLSGILEGKLPGGAEFEDRLRQWIEFANSLGLAFHLELEGNSYSILADSKPLPVEAIGPDPAEKVAAALGELLKVFGDDERRQVFSTIRSVEYRKGQEVQTLFHVGPDGDVRMRERTVEADTSPAQHRLTRREKIRIGAIGLVVALAVFGVSSLFVEYRALFARVAEGITPLRAEALEIDTSTFRSYFRVGKKTIESGGKALRLTLTRTDAYPKSDQELARLIGEAQENLARRLAAEALASGYVRCEVFDKQGRFLGFEMQRIAGLRQGPSADLVLPLPTKQRPARIVITY
jgi:hypothetical protein